MAGDFLGRSYAGASLIKIDREIVVARPPEAVFDYLADVKRFPQWQPAIERAEQLTPGPLAPGTKLRLVIRAPTGATDVTGEIVALDRSSLLAVRTLTGPAAVEASCSLAAAGDGTRVTFKATIELKGMLRFVEGAARGMIERELPKTLADLARRIESEA
jgi:carbon monoxide dehydrogenase subunit G